MNVGESIALIVGKAVEEVVQNDGATEVPPCLDTTVLLGDEACLDSMGFVNFVVAVEDGLKSELGISLNVAELLDTDPERPKPPLTVGTLTEFLARFLADRSSSQLERTSSARV